MYKDSKEKREEENKELKKQKLKIIEYIEWLSKNLIEKGICKQYKDNNSFSKIHCLDKCENKFNCKGNEKIKLEEEKLNLIDKEIKDNQDYINRDSFFN